MPSDLAPGNHSLVIIGISTNGLATWRQAILVTARPVLRMSPNPAPAGSWLSVSGSCPDARSISLISAGFDNRGSHDWDGTNGVWRFTGSGAEGSFSGRLLVKSTASGAYRVTIRCDGGLAGHATLTVRPALAATGGPVLADLVIGGLSLLLGLILVRIARRRPAR